MAIWLCLSPVLGLVLEGIGFPPAFVTVAVLLVVGGIWTARLPEPRFR